MAKINAKDEFLQITSNQIVIGAAIGFGGENLFRLRPGYSKKSYENFLDCLDREYNHGYGGQELFGTIYCEDGIWFDRGEYDGSEWWNYNKYPDLKDSFNKSDILKYERNKKLNQINKSSSSL